MKWIDLGLPSGTLWAEQNEDGYYDWYNAQKQFMNSLPESQDFKELMKHCYRRWNDERKGLEFIGQNGAKLFFPALGMLYWKDVYDIYSVGSYICCNIPNLSCMYIMIFDIYGECIKAMSNDYNVSVRLIKRGGEE